MTVALTLAFVLMCAAFAAMVGHAVAARSMPGLALTLAVAGFAAGALAMGIGL